VFAVQEVIRRTRKDELKDLVTKIGFDFNPAGIRKKARRERSSLTPASGLRRRERDTWQKRFTT
jgi:hypothetical protein